MPLTAKGQEILKSMEKTYGPAKAEQVLYASKNAGKISGIDAAMDAVDAICDSVVKLNQRFDAMCSRADARADDRRVIGGVNSGTIANWASDAEENVSVRGSGKVHPAWMESGTNSAGKKYSKFRLLCSCPGSQNGSLANRCSLVSQGFGAANCGNFSSSLKG